VERTVQKYAQTGFAGIMIEDQVKIEELFVDDLFIMY
jgi:2-methylisocitrate lyase-like PEP mutase family enzyme